MREPHRILTPLLLTLAAWAGVGGASAVAQERCPDAAGAQVALASCEEAVEERRFCDGLEACLKAEALCATAEVSTAPLRGRAVAGCRQPCEATADCLASAHVCQAGRCVVDPNAEERVLAELLLASEPPVVPCAARDHLARARRMAEDANLTHRLPMVDVHLEEAEARCRLARSGQVASAIVGRDGAPMVLVAGGRFMRGSDDDSVRLGLAVCRSSYASPDDCTAAWFDRERPAGEIALEPFYIDRYEVTNARYARCVEAGGCAPLEYDRCRLFEAASNTWKKGGEPGSYVAAADHPAVCVTWSEADAYCRWAGKRLPTEAEWEKAARGTDGRQFPWGDTWEPTFLNWGEVNDYGAIDGVEATAPVGAFAANVSPYGAMDMAGNVWEWTMDWHDDDFYARSPKENPRNAEPSGYKVLRGGSWRFAGNGARTTYRYFDAPTTREDAIGFRCVLGSP